MAVRKDPLITYHFALQFDGITAATFREAGGFESETEVVEDRHAGPKGQTIIRKLPGALKWGAITLKWGLTDDLTLYKWRQDIENGKITRKNGSIVCYDPSDKEVMRFNFIEAWPSKWKGPDMNATNNQVAVEELTIQHEGLKRVK